MCLVKSKSYDHKIIKSQNQRTLTFLNNFEHYGVKEGLFTDFGGRILIGYDMIDAEILIGVIFLIFCVKAFRETFSILLQLILFQLFKKENSTCYVRSDESRSRYDN